MTNPFGAARPIPTIASEADRVRVAAFLRGVFAWMCVGLALTAGVAAGVAMSPGIVNALVSSKLLFYGLIILELVLVVFLAARVATMSPAIAGALFVAYAALNGVTFSLILLVYTGASVATAFLVAAGMFGSLALYGSRRPSATCRRWAASCSWGSSG